MDYANKNALQDIFLQRFLLIHISLMTITTNVINAMKIAKLAQKKEIQII